MSLLEWSDPDRRDDALIRVLVRAHSQPWPHETRENLTDKERRLVQALASGLTIKEAAVVLGVTFHTARVEVRRVRRMLQAKTNAHAVAVAMRRGEIE